MGVLAKLIITTLSAFYALGWLPTPAFATDRQWTGAVNDYWSEPGNWNPAGAPQNGDNLKFTSGSDSHRNMINDVTNLAISDLIFAQTDNNYGLSGNSLTVATIGSTPDGSSTITINCALVFTNGGIIDAGPSADGLVTENTAVISLNGPVTVNVGQLTLRPHVSGVIQGVGGSNGRIYVSGQLSGSGDVLAQAGLYPGVESDCSVEFDGTDDNTLTGTLYLDTFDSNEIVFNKTAGHAVNSTLDVAYESYARANGEPYANLKLNSPNQIGPNTTVVAEYGGQLFVERQ